MSLSCEEVSLSEPEPEREKRRSRSLLGLCTAQLGLEVVFESLVRSGLLAHFWKDRDRDRSTLIPEWKKTGPDRRKPVFCGLLQSFSDLRLVFSLFGFNQFRTGFLD
jgi:hypothetical protein